jgi:hypothetical protein
MMAGEALCPPPADAIGTAVAPPQLDEFFCTDDAPLRAPDLAALGFTEAMIFGE